MAQQSLFALTLAVHAHAVCEDESSLLQVAPLEKRFGLQEAVSLHRRGEVDHCSGEQFQVMINQTCHEVTQACTDLARICCEQEGGEIFETCSGHTSKLTAGDLCHAVYGEAPCGSLAPKEKWWAFPKMPLDWWPKALPQIDAWVHKKSQKKVTCDGQPFTVASGDTCSTYQTACPGLWFLCCDQAGQTCSAEKSMLLAQDTCWASYGRSCSEGPEPKPTQQPTQQPGSLKVGDWIKTWSPHQLIPDPWMNICFSGYAKLSVAMGECERTKSSMPPGPLWLSLGGGNCDSSIGGSVTWSQEVVEDLIASIPTVDLSSYKGIFFDLETNSGGCKAAVAAGQEITCGASSGTSYGISPSAELMVQAFQAVKAIGLDVGVSWSYQMPYCMDNAAEIVQAALASDAVSLVSPQMYNGGGTFTSQETQAAPWNGNSHVSYSDYVNVKGAIYPSYTLVNGNYDMTKNLENMEQMQHDMLNWAKGQGIQSFMDSPGCLAYQDS